MKIIQKEIQRHRSTNDYEQGEDETRKKWKERARKWGEREGK
jgi:hypothetical protein